MPKEYSDLRELLDEILRTVPDSRSVWCTASIHFETTVARRRGLLLGGAWAPQLLGETEDLWPVPWTMTLQQPRVLAVEKVLSPFWWKWLPLLEGVAKAEESLIVAAEEIGDDFLRTLVANLARRTIKASAVRSAADVSLLGGACAEPPVDHRDLPQMKEAWVRKGASVVFPRDDAGCPSEVAVIEVGGEDCEDQRARLRFLAEAIREADRRAAVETKT